MKDILPVLTLFLCCSLKLYFRKKMRPKNIRVADCPKFPMKNLFLILCLKTTLPKHVKMYKLNLNFKIYEMRLK